MTTRLASLGLTIACAVLVAACAAPADPRSTEQQLIAQADAWDKAIVRKDRAAIESNMASRFFHIGGDGSTSERDEFVADLLDPELSIDPYAVEDLRVRLHGDTALLSATTRMTGRYKGKPFETHYRYIDTYVRENGHWKIVAVQITQLKK
ncbi:MAG TPA: nuclear transport factor 2 family protein [Albitalea sp.]|uniref:nuclear transport factor 2 family protein n=1 Tax=Piscinibacter sp. TaxID=1903157 RepID=UPI002ED279CF